MGKEGFFGGGELYEELLMQNTSEDMCDPGHWEGERSQASWRVDEGPRALLSGQQALLCGQAPPVISSV